MSLTDFLHGVETVTVLNGTRPIQTVRSSVIGLIYTAPDADTLRFPLNKPTLFNRRSDMQGLGASGTGPRALDSIFDQIGALVVGVRVEQGTTERETLANVIGGVDLVTGELEGVHAFRKAEADLGVSPMILLAPGFTHQRPNGLKALSIGGSGGTGYTAATVKFTDASAEAGAIMPTVTLTVEGGKVVGYRILTPGFGVTSDLTATVEGNGTGATLTVTVAPTTNPVAGEMLQIADALRAHILVDGPSTTDAAAIATRGDFGSRRVFIIDPHVSGFSQTQGEYVIEAGSARVAGHIARVDNTEGWWESPSNREVYGIGGLARPIDYAYGDKASRANLLNENCVATFIRDDGWYLWGNLTCSIDPMFQFLSVSRATDIIDISIAKAHRWAVDRGIKRSYYDDVAASVNAFFRKLKRDGAIIDGECFVDPEFNLPTDISGGHATFSYDFSAIYPAQRVTFRSSLTDRYLSQIFA